MRKTLVLVIMVGIASMVHAEDVQRMDRLELKTGSTYFGLQVDAAGGLLVSNASRTGTSGLSTSSITASMARAIASDASQSSSVANMKLVDASLQSSASVALATNNSQSTTLANMLDVDSTTTNLVFTAATSKNFTISADTTAPVIEWGEAWVDAASSTTVYYEGFITFYSDSSYSGRSEVSRYAISLLTTQILATCTVGAATLTVSDSTGFTGNMKVWLTSTAGTESARISSVTTATDKLNLRDNIKYAHPAGGLSKVEVMGDFSSITIPAQSATLYGRVSTVASATCSVKVRVQVR